jgi:hypothetical protein
LIDFKFNLRKEYGLQRRQRKQKSDELSVRPIQENVVASKRC